jgi:hypothetical protein
MRKTTLSMLLLAAPLAFAANGYGYDYNEYNYSTDVQGRDVSISLIERSSGQAMALYQWRGQHIAAGNEGSPYAVRLTNRTGRRVMVVLAVDGINVLSGQNAAARSTDGGYVLGPWETADIAGWRKSLSHVAQFYFTNPENSYAGRTDRENQVGVIGAAVFEERQWRPLPRRYPEIYPMDKSRSEQGAQPPPPAMSGAPMAKSAGRAAPMMAPSAPSMSSANGSGASDEAARELGTGHGANEWSPVGQTQFNARSQYPAETLRIDYDTPQALERRGIHVRGRAGGGMEPDAFPGGFVPDPAE